MPEITATYSPTLVNSFVQYFVRLVHDPTHLDNGFDLIEIINAGAPDDYALQESFIQAPHMRAFFEQPYKPLQIDIEALSTLPQGTLGRALADSMTSQGLSPDAMRRIPGDDPLSRLQDHLSTTHDLWHVVTGFDTDVAGETALQAFYQAQIGDYASLAIMSGVLLNTMLHNHEDGARRMEAIVQGWQMGTSVRPLVGTDWATMWELPLQEVRQYFGIELAEDVRAAA